MPKENGAAIVAGAPSFGWRAGRSGAHTSDDSNPTNGMKKKGQHHRWYLSGHSRAGGWMFEK